MRAEVLNFALFLLLYYYKGDCYATTKIQLSYGKEQGLQHI